MRLERKRGRGTVHSISPQSPMGAIEAPKRKDNI